MEYQFIAYGAIGLAALYLGLRIIGELAISRVVETEYEYILNAAEHKVKGRFE